MKVKLQKHFFETKEQTILETNSFTASIFKYSSGIEAVKLQNEIGYIIVLPYNGQMIWEAFFYGNSIKMETPFPEPVKSELFGGTYGCYLMHCGMNAMGVPKETDNHSPHGDTPYANYKNAEIITGSNSKGNYIAVTGEYEHNIAFDQHYIAQPLVKLYENSGMLEVSMKTKNLSRKNMDLMYLCHINNKFVPDGKIYQTLDWDADHMAIQEIDQTTADQNLLDLFNRIKKDPASSNPISEGDYYDPEIVFFLRNMKTDQQDNAHFLYVLPDQSAYYTYFDTKVLNHGVRWIAYHEDCHSMGFVLPATAESEGYTAEKSKGNLLSLGTNQEFEATVFCGVIPHEEADQIIKKIAKINQK